MKKQITMERTLDGTLDDVWELWTTKDGIESWWGPEGFETKVAKLELLDLEPRVEQVFMHVRFDAMHDEQYTRFAERGWTEELNKLERRLAKRSAR